MIRDGVRTLIEVLGVITLVVGLWAAVGYVCYLLAEWWREDRR